MTYGGHYIGALGYLRCWDEILEQSQTLYGQLPDLILTMDDTGGAHAGLMAGAMRDAREVPLLVGASVRTSSHLMKSKIERMAPTRQNSQLRSPLLRVVDARYGSHTQNLVLDGLSAEGVHFSSEERRAFLALLKFLETHHLPENALVVFLHNGVSVLPSPQGVNPQDML